MNRKIIYGLSFMAGAVIGGSVSWFIQKKKFDQKLEEEAAKNQEYYLNLLGYHEPDEKEVPEELKDEPASVEHTIVDTGDGIQRTYNYTGKLDQQKKQFLEEKARIKYDKIPQIVPEDQEEEVDEVTLEVNDDNPEQDIVIITAEQFAREHLGFDKVTLKWWPKNKLLSTEDYEILDIPDLVGTQWKDRIGEFERDTVYVRNFTAETDYEILEQHDSYYDYLE